MSVNTQMPIPPAGVMEFPGFAAFNKPPEELRQASEKMLNFWVGASIPLWAPFFAAASFGIGTWALTQAMQRQQELMKDMPVGRFWAAAGSASEQMLNRELEKAGETLPPPKMPVPVAADLTPAPVSPAEAVMAVTTGMMNESIGMAARTIETATETMTSAIEAVTDVAKPVSTSIPSIAVSATKPSSRRRPARKA